MECEKCGKELQVGDFPFCPHGMGSGRVVQDSIEGGVLIEHGLCNPDGTPKRYYSKSEIAAEAKRRGLVNWVEHIPYDKGTDKSPHTVRWVSAPVQTEEERLAHWHAHEATLRK